MLIHLWHIPRAMTVTSNNLSQRKSLMYNTYDVGTLSDDAKSSTAWFECYWLSFRSSGMENMRSVDSSSLDFDSLHRQIMLRDITWPCHPLLDRQKISNLTRMWRNPNPFGFNSSCHVFCIKWETSMWQCQLDRDLPTTDRDKRTDTVLWSGVLPRTTNWMLETPKQEEDGLLEWM